MYGAYAALPVFLRQGHGTLINTVSLGAWVPTPYAAAYTASKFGLRGFGASLRQELGAYPNIHVCGVFPAIVDTPGLEHAANVSGRQINPGPLIYAPEDVANAILSLARSPRDEVAVGWPARAGQVAYAIARGPTERFSGAIVRHALEKADAAPRTEGALLHPIGRGSLTRMRNTGEHAAPASSDGDPCASAGEGQCGRPADPALSTRDDDGRSLQVFHIVTPRL